MSAVCRQHPELHSVWARQHLLSGLIGACRRLYSSSGSGVEVFAPSGQLLGAIVLPPQTAPSAGSNQTTQNVVFAGARLVVPHHRNLLLLSLNTHSSLPPMNTAWSVVQRLIGTALEWCSGLVPHQTPPVPSSEEEL